MGPRVQFFVSAVIVAGLMATAVFWPSGPEGVHRVWERYGLEVVHQLNNDWESVGPIGATVTMQDPTREETEAFMRVLEPELTRLPDGFFRKIEFRYLVLGKKLLYPDGERFPVSAMNVGPEKGPAMYVYFDVEKNKNPESLRRSFWHELYHFVEAVLGEPVEDLDWMSLNPKGFEYGKALKGTSADSMKFAPKGAFLNGYSTKEIREDKAEFFVALIHDSEKLKKAGGEWPAIGKKAALMEKRLKAWGDKISLPFWPLGERLPTNP